MRQQTKKEKEKRIGSIHFMHATLRMLIELPGKLSESLHSGGLLDNWMKETISIITVWPIQSRSQEHNYTVSSITSTSQYYFSWQPLFWLHLFMSKFLGLTASASHGVMDCCWRSLVSALVRLHYYSLSLVPWLRTIITKQYTRTKTPHS